MRAQSLQYSFVVPLRHSASLRVTLKLNDDPIRSGSRLIFPEQPISAFADFPLCNAAVESLVDYGYAATYGWVQMVREAPLGPVNSHAKFMMDFIPITNDLNNPFIYFGSSPRLFDAPFRINRTDMDWTSWTFLTYIPDACVSRSVTPILSFKWGFHIEDGNVAIKNLEHINTHEAWEQQRNLLERQFSGWTFNPVNPNVKVTEIEKRFE